MTGWILLFLSILMSFLIYVNGTDPNCEHSHEDLFSEKLTAQEKKDLIWKPFIREGKNSSVQNEGGEEDLIMKR
jgi:hypothetical protein